MQDLILENSRLRSENQKLSNTVLEIKDILKEISVEIKEIKHELKTNKPVVSIPSINFPINVDSNMQKKDFSEQKNQSMFIPTPDPDSLKDGISKQIRSKKLNKDLLMAAAKLRDVKKE